MRPNGEIYVSTDIEADGPIPGPHSMLSLGSAAYLPSGALHSTFSVNLVQLEGAQPDPSTQAFWDKNPDAWAKCRQDPEAPHLAMSRYSDWLNSLPGRPVFVGYPASYDFLFVYWYLIKFTGKSPFSFSALDIKSYAMAMLKLPYRESVKRNMPKRWFPTEPHTHVAVEDAIEQGALFCAMLRENIGS